MDVVVRVIDTQHVTVAAEFGEDPAAVAARAAGTLAAPDAGVERELVVLPSEGSV